LSQIDFITPGLEDLLTSLERTIAELRDGSAPLDQLVSAHQRALQLLSQAQERMTLLRERADKAAAAIAE
jgi:exonuclease VII small subunit